MWSDNETNRDFLNFRAVAETAAEMIVQANGRPLSLGVSGGWGVGKSSMIKLIQQELTGREGREFVFIEFNAWLYQGYDDARAALMEVIGRGLLKYAGENKKPTDRVLEFLGRVRWARVAGLAAGTAASFAVGVPLPGVIGAAWNAVRGLADNEITKEDMEAARKAGKELADTGNGLTNPKQERSPPKEIQDLRDHFEATLEELDVTLVVLIDDLDRCLPPTAIATLEAIRLFLFLDHTAFVIAADDKMIRHAVRAHFKDIALDDDLVTNYFDKLIQVPIRVPPLGTQDVRAYLMLLFIENSTLTQEQRDHLRVAICKQLGQTWTGKRVDKSFVMSLITECPPDLAHHLDLADRLAPLMTTAKQIAGNPRLIKRFLNTLSIRLAIARAQHVTVDEAALAKMLLFERCGSEDAYSQLVSAINGSDEGKPAFLKPWEEAAENGQVPDGLPAEWATPFARDWLALPPAFADQDLRAVVYVSREHLPIITAADQLSSEGADLLAALIELKSQASEELTRRLKPLPKREVGAIMDRVLERARQVQEWSAPPILFAGLTVAAVDSEQEAALARFLRQIPPSQIRAPIVPLLADKLWARDVLAHWASQKETSAPVKKAIASASKEAR